MNPETNEFEELKELKKKNELESLEKMIRDGEHPNFVTDLVRPNGEPVPEHWPVFAVGEMVAIKDYTFKVAHIGEKHILFEPVGPVINESKNK